MKLIPVASKRQDEQMRIMYAVGLAVKHYTLTPNDLFEKGVNPEWFKSMDLGSRNPFLTLYDWQKKDLWTKGICDMGLFKVRKTKKGFVVFMNICRLKQKRVKG